MLSKRKLNGGFHKTTILTDIIFFTLIFSCNNHSKPIKLSEPITGEIGRKYKKGEALFNQHCESCHRAPQKSGDDQYTFENFFLENSIVLEKYFIRFVADSKELRTQGNARAIAIHEARNSKYNHSFQKKISAEDFGDLIIYLKNGVKERYNKQ